VSMDERGASAKSAVVLAYVSMVDRGTSAKSVEVLASVSMDEEGTDARLRSAAALLAKRGSVLSFVQC
jgi:hypothetical protein